MRKLLLALALSACGASVEPITQAEVCQDMLDRLCECCPVPTVDDYEWCSADVADWNLIGIGQCQSTAELSCDEIMEQGQCQ